MDYLNISRFLFSISEELEGEQTKFLIKALSDEGFRKSFARIIQDAGDSKGYFTRIRDCVNSCSTHYAEAVVYFAITLHMDTTLNHWCHSDLDVMLGSEANVIRCFEMLGFSIPVTK